MQELLKLSQLDVYELASSGEDAARFLAELAVLHKREVIFQSLHDSSLPESMRLVQVRQDSSNASHVLLCVCRLQMHEQILLHCKPFHSSHNALGKSNLIRTNFCVLTRVVRG